MKEGKPRRNRSTSEGRGVRIDRTKIEESVAALLSKGISRRDFMRLAAGAGVMLSVDHIFRDCGTADAGTRHENRTYYFDLSHANPNGDPKRQYHIVAGSRKYRLKRVTPAVLRGFRKKNPHLAAVPESSITHYASNARFPRNAHQLCYVRSSYPHSKEWRIEALFIHIPRDYENALAAHQQKNTGSFRGSQKLKFYSVDNTAGQCSSTGADGSDGTDCPGVPDDYKTYFETATSLIFHHPEVMSLDAGTATYVLNSVVCSMDETKQLAGSIYDQLKAGGSWAVYTKIDIDPNDINPDLDTGGDQYAVTWTDETTRYAGKAINAVVKLLKNDTSLGANVTDRTSGGATAGTNSDFQGKLWLMRDGVPSVDLSVASAGNVLKQMGASSKINYTLNNQSTERGFNIPHASVAATTDPSTVRVTVEVHNWYIRYLGLYVRYLDSNGNKLPVPDSIWNTLEGWQKDHSGPKDPPGGPYYDTLWGIINPELAVLGVPLKDFDHSFSFPVPEAASSVMIIAGGLGTGHTDYTVALPVGSTATFVVNLVIPIMFLIAAACSAYGSFIEDFQVEAAAIGAMAFLFAGVFDTIIYTEETHDAGVYMNLAGAVAGVFLKMAAAWLIKKIVFYIAKGEAKNAIPLIGGILSAIAAAGTAAQIGETISQVIRSPKTFDYKLSLIHDVTVTINHDHNDTSGFPATAATYEVIALLDNATTRKSGRLPLTDFRVNQVSYTFKDLPYGGMVRYSVGFYAEDGWCAGQAQTATMDNNVDAVSMEITENEVPLTQNTYYWHLQKTEVDPSSGSLIWYGDHQSPAPAPTLKAADLNCGNPAGRLCSLGGITVSGTYAALGLTWQSSSEAISDCGGAGTGQLYQFGTLSTHGSPQSSAIVPVCGSRFPFMMVFSLLGKNNDNYYLDPTTGQYHVRQIRFSGPGQGAAYDPPGSNLSFGRLNLPSDGMLLHQGKIISINRQMSVMEILNLPAAAGPDSSAPVATTASDPGTREGLISGPTCIGITADGTILVLESVNQRVQAFDTGGNPVKLFNNKSDYYFQLKSESESIHYLDMAVEYAGYIYVLSYGVSTGIYRLDIYKPDGTWLCQTANVNAGALSLDFWRNVYTLNYEALISRGITSPSVSLWIPSVP